MVDIRFARPHKRWVDISPNVDVVHQGAPDSFAQKPTSCLVSPIPLVTVQAVVGRVG